MIFSKRTYIIIITLALGVSLFYTFRNPKILFFNFINITNDCLLNADLENAAIEGVSIPSKLEIKEGYITYNFKVFNTTFQPLYYKVFYKNTSYGFNEEDFQNENDLHKENFYGSWNNYSGGFKKINTGLYKNITDSIKIIGNPLDNPIYFGASYSKYLVNQKIINDEIAYINTEPEWVESIKNKAALNKTPVEKQFLIDALWSIKSRRGKGEENHRWKNNPRMGDYDLMIICCTKEALDKIPYYVQDVRLKDENGNYQNPFFYFKKGKGKNIAGCTVIQIKDFIKVKSKINLEKGIYVDFTQFPGGIKDSAVNSNCNYDLKKFKEAHIEQFFHRENYDFVMNTIPVIRDVLNDEYSFSDYLKNEKEYNLKNTISNIIRNTDCPCKTVDYKNNYITIKNPGSASLNNARKENVGVKTRIGYTYGKYTAKVHFPHLINKSNVWSGITNAMWLLYQEEESWNNRRWSAKGYTPKGVGGANPPRINTTYYSEIDFEILKASKYWPKSSYGGMKNYPSEDAQKTNDVVITTTNWDLANQDPKNYFGGIKEIKFGEDKFSPHRWDVWYQALTNRFAIKDSELFNQPFYYQIEWSPKEIIWRVGKTKESLKVVGYMNDEITNIPNNQMILVFTQEYHLSEWWPPVVFKQNLIPFPRNPIEGKIYSIEIE